MRRVRKRKKKNHNRLRLIGVVVFLAALITALVIWNRSKRISFVRYEAFGIDMPIAYDIHGIDVSRYQQYIDWKEVKEMKVQQIQLGFAFIKATEGERGVDPYFKRNWGISRKSGIVRGAYHYFIPSKDAKQQANFFISSVKLLPGDLPPVLDVEQTNNIPEILLQAKVKAWLETVEAHYKIKPIIYTNADFYKKYLGAPFDDYPLWVAHYYEQHKPCINRPWMFWQHNDRGNVNGIRYKADFNVFSGDSAAFKNLLLK